MVLAGTGRSATGQIGAPVSRCSTKSIPVFVATSTAGSSRPSRRTVASTGGLALS
jgi:CRISPR/Cas system CMR subunit Cmr4 (Cas7 group RAMP superfamily)